MIAERCRRCDREFLTPTAYAPFCPSCEREVEAEYAVPVVFTDPWRWSRVAMQERLGVTGREDV